MNYMSKGTRLASLQKMKNQKFDLAIIGGGITGAGVARDAASRGFKVALIEANDFASGTSSRSSKLIHGGIRYLEQLEFHLVFEALSERRRLFEIAPHLVHPLRFVIPLYKGGRVGMFKMGLGMWLYDVLSLFEAPELHARLETDEVMERFPFLKQNELLGAYAYSDAYMDDDRLVHETMRSAHAFGATCANYVKAVSAKMENGKVIAIGCVDQESGESFELQARHFVSTVGPWTDLVGHDLLKEWKKLLRPSKGVHLTFHKERLPVKEALVMAAEARIVFAIPRHEMVIVGTTDTDYTANPSDVHTEKADVAYLLQVIDRYFPEAHIQESDILSSYAGIRPLIDDGSSTESQTSREHLIYHDPRNITFVAGGKYTTYRKMAEDTVNEILDLWDSKDKLRFSKSQTLRPLNPLVSGELLDSARKMISFWATESGVPLQIVTELVERHGAEARAILSGVSDEDLSMADSQKLLWKLESRHATRTTMCLHLRDFYFRRSPLFLAKDDHGLSFLETIADEMGRQLGWSDKVKADEINALQKQIHFELDWRH